jgi:hypothetical protein
MATLPSMSFHPPDSDKSEVLWEDQLVNRFCLNEWSFDFTIICAMLPLNRPRDALLAIFEGMSISTFRLQPISSHLQQGGNLGKGYVSNLACRCLLPPREQATIVMLSTLAQIGSCTLATR